MKNNIVCGKRAALEAGAGRGDGEKLLSYSRSAGDFCVFVAGEPLRADMRTFTRIKSICWSRFSTTRLLGFSWSAEAGSGSCGSWDTQGSLLVLTLRPSAPERRGRCCKSTSAPRGTRRFTREPRGLAKLRGVAANLNATPTESRAFRREQEADGCPRSSPWPKSQSSKQLFQLTAAQV